MRSKDKIYKYTRPTDGVTGNNKGKGVDTLQGTLYVTPAVKGRSEVTTQDTNTAEDERSVSSKLIYSVSGKCNYLIYTNQHFDSYYYQHYA